MNFSITVMPLNPVNLDMLTGEAEAIFRIVRNLNPRDESDFNVTKSDNIVKLLLKNIKYVTLAATINRYCYIIRSSCRTDEYNACFSHRTYTGNRSKKSHRSKAQDN